MNRWWWISLLLLTGCADLNMFRHSPEDFGRGVPEFKRLAEESRKQWEAEQAKKAEEAKEENHKNHLTSPARPMIR